MAEVEGAQGRADALAGAVLDADGQGLELKLKRGIQCSDGNERRVESVDTLAQCCISLLPLVLTAIISSSVQFKSRLYYTVLHDMHVRHN